MKTNSHTLLQELAAIALKSSDAVAALQQLSDSELSYKPGHDAWSVLECLEHLNLYSAFYLPEIEKTLKNHPAYTGEGIFKSGLIGNFLVNIIIPKENGKKIKTFAAMNPAGKKPDREAIDQFLRYQQQLLGLITQSQNADLNKGALPVTFSKLIKMKLGDALRFMTYHNQRHVQQALRNIKNLQSVI
jgi:hypothetical protein